MTSLAVCDTCRSRKVKCDRNDPCGNCVDSNIQCNRTISSSRNASKRRRGGENATALQGMPHLGTEVDFTPSPPRSTSAAQSPSIVEAHDFIRREITSGKPIPADRLAVLNSAMTFVSRLSQSTKHENAVDRRNTRVANILEDIDHPSIELLYWMLRELKGKSFGPHVLDYFKHVSPKSLKTMGHALINRTADTETLLLYSICVNSAAYKFIKTVLSEGDSGPLEDGMRNQAAIYLRSVQLAMKRIHLLAAPSLLFLQSLLCSAFIAQGQGDSVHCWAFISAACKTCDDLNLESQVNECQSASEDDVELYYCYVWCHILDKNYSMMLGRSRCLLNHEGLDAVFSSPLNGLLSSLLSTYLLFVPVQAIFILELHPSKISNKTALLSRVDYVVTDLLDRLKRIHTRITELHGPSDTWSGLHMGSELTTIQFSYHSLRTSILRSKQICSPAQAYVDYDCLESARMAMSTLRSIQEAALSGTDIRSHVAYMHWTVLYHPLTPFFVLFCNVVATSDPDDFHTLKCVTDELEDLTELSSSIAKLQMLFKSFLELCEGLVSEKRLRISAVELEPVAQTFLHEQSALPTHEPLHQISNTFRDDTINNPRIQQPTSEPLHTSVIDVTTDTNVNADPGWGLFDVQPTLDWLDVDLSIFDNEIYHQS